ncbi:unnamed protein product, partial [Rotaria sp. Silwood2]
PIVCKLYVGQRVVVAFNIACGFCEYCQRQEYAVCDTIYSSKLQEKLHQQKKVTLFGHSCLKSAGLGGQAEYIRVPFADINCLPIPNDVPDDKALYLSDIIPTAFHGCHIGNVKEGSIVAIWSLGPIGLLQARWCQILGAKRIIGIDYVPKRLKIAHQSLQIETINVKECDTMKTLLEMVPGGADCSLQAVDFNYSKSLLYKDERSLQSTADVDILTEIIACTRKCGTISIIGDYNNVINHIPIRLIMEKNLRIIGGQSHTQKYWPTCLHKVLSGEIDPTFIITHSFNINHLSNYYEQLIDEETLKCFIQVQN